MCGDTHFDEDENWKLRKGTFEDPSLLAVAIHEFGHAIGLEHSRNIHSVMAPFVKDIQMELTEDDILAAQRLYGNYSLGRKMLKYFKLK